MLEAYENRLPGERLSLIVSLPFLSVHVGAVYALTISPSPFALFMVGLMYFIRMFGITAGFHRLFSHRSFKTNRLYTISEGSHETRIHSQIEAICDVVIQLEVGRMAAEFENRLIIKKIRNHPEKAAVMIYAVTEHGITPEMITRVA